MSHQPTSCSFQIRTPGHHHALCYVPITTPRSQSQDVAQCTHEARATLLILLLMLAGGCPTGLPDLPPVWHGMVPPGSTIVPSADLPRHGFKETLIARVLAFSLFVFCP